MNQTGGGWIYKTDWCLKTWNYFKIDGVFLPVIKQIGYKHIFQINKPIYILTYCSGLIECLHA